MHASEGRRFGVTLTNSWRHLCARRHNRERGRGRTGHNLDPAAEYGPRGVRVSAVNPGPTRTEGTAAMGERLDQLAGLAPAGRPGTAEEIASAVVYLAGDAAAFMHGAVLAVDGGRTATS
ncbi:hypothetical protein GCM10022252_79010 [Streptosporangium oxazolinicum]|uniref:SDR family oxidoreductase n=1 Tax=Streptosporangium oxazolinicum TaxID=909287 RepID=A0ABP8BMU9_9ACTN